MLLIYILLTIIAIGVLLLSEPGQKFLGTIVGYFSCLVSIVLSLIALVGIYFLIIWADKQGYSEPIFWFVFIAVIVIGWGYIFYGIIKEKIKDKKKIKHKKKDEVKNEITKAKK